MVLNFLRARSSSVRGKAIFPFVPPRRWRSLTNLRNFERLRAFTLHRITWLGIIYHGREREQLRDGVRLLGPFLEGFRLTVNRPTTAHHFKFSSFPLSAHVARILTGAERYRVNLLSFRDTRHATRDDLAPLTSCPSIPSCYRAGTIPLGQLVCSPGYSDE